MKNIALLFIFVFLAFLSCEKKEENPQVKTVSVTALSASSCLVKGLLADPGNIPITDHGFVYYFGNDNNSNVIQFNYEVSLGKDISSDTFSAVIPMTESYYSSTYKYIIRAYVKNEKGIIYGNTVSIAPLQLSVSGISASAGKIGDTITITGNNFDLNINNDKVEFYYGYSYFTAKITSASKTKLKVVVPDITSGYYSDTYCDIRVSLGNQSVTLTDAFSYLPSVTGFSPNSGTFGTSITIYGTNLSSSTIMFGDISVYSYSSYSNYITVSVPYTMNVKKCKIYVVKGNVKMEVPGGVFSMNKLEAYSFSPVKAYVGNVVTISGNNFNSNYNGTNAVFIGSTKISSLYSNYSTSLSFTVPATIPAGDYELSATNGVDTVKLPGTLKIVAPSITGISPSSGYWGTDLTVSGHNFNTSSSYNVYFNSSNVYSYSIDSTAYKLKIPTSLTPGIYKVYVSSGSSQIQSPTNFTLLAPDLTSITPSNGNAGTAVIITGVGFGGSSNSVSVKFGNTYAAISMVNDTQINAVVPSGIGNGAWIVTVIINGYTIVKTLTFNVP